MGVTSYSKGSPYNQYLDEETPNEINDIQKTNNTEHYLDSDSSSTSSEPEPVLSNTNETSNDSQHINSESKIQATLFSNMFECSIDTSKTVTVNLPIEENGELSLVSFMIDTGSDVTAIKASKLKYPNNINKEEIISILGITKDPLYTMGTSQIKLCLNDAKIDHTIHALSKDINLPSDGIIGNDLLRKYDCKINYIDNTLTIMNHSLPLQDTALQNQDFTANEISINPRTETIVKINIANPEINEGIVSKTEIQNGVYIASSIVKVDENSQALTTVLNTTNHIVTFPHLSITLEPIKSLKICNVTKITNHSTEQSKLNRNCDRNKKLVESLRLDHLSQEEKDSLLHICKDYNDIFHLEDDVLPETSEIEHAINTTSDTPIAAKTYRYPQVHKDEVHRQIENMLDQGIITHSTSPWSAPIWVVPKKTDASGKTKWRIVIDYRALNSVTIQDSFPLPNITDILDQLGNAKYFSCLDCYSGFHSIKIRERDAPKTAFSTDLGHYQFQRMPFGLKNAPATFQRLMNSILTGLQGTRVFVYMDDVIVYGSNLKDHNEKLKEVFERLKCSNLKLQPDKCEFLRKEVIFLGHKITENGVQPNPDKVKCVQEYPIPKNIKDVQAFLGLCNYYRRFIKDFASIAKPLTDLTKKGNAFNWTETQQNAFQTLKFKLCSEPILKYPNFQEPFILTTDASDFAISGILSQGNIPDDLPVSYASRTLNPAERNYSTIEKELLAIVWAVRYYRPYLYGRTFTIYTDHKPLTYLFNVKDPSSRLLRWRLKLEAYSYTIKYKPGKKNNNADALSRAFNPETNLNQSSHLTEQIKPPNCHVKEMKRQRDPAYEDFIKEISHTLIINNNITETQDSILKSKDNIVIPISEDLDTCQDKLLQDILEKTNHLNDIQQYKPSSKNVIILPYGNRVIIYIVTKKHFSDKIQLPVLFDTLTTLKNTMLQNGITSISIPKLSGNDRLSWPEIRSMLRYIFYNTQIKITIHYHTKMTPNSEDILKILEENHSLPHSGHFGFLKTYEKIKSKYYWPSMKEDIKRFIQTCSSCQENKLVRIKHKEPMVITDISTEKFQKIALDIVGPFPLTESGNKYLLTIQDNLTKYSQAYPIPNQEAETVARTFVNEFVCKFALPEEILTDQGTNFMSNLFKSIAKLFKIKHIQTTAYHPESNGALERTHHTLTEYLKHYINNKQTDWDQWIPMATFAFNTTVHSSTKFTPYELVFGIQPNLPTSITQPTKFKYSYDDYVQELKMKLNTSYELARENLRQSKEINKKYYDKKTHHQQYKIGDLVYLLNETNTLSNSRKLKPSYIGPFEVISIDSPVNVTIKMKKRYVKVHTNRIKPAFVTGME